MQRQKLKVHSTLLFCVRFDFIPPSVEEQVVLVCNTILSTIQTKKNFEFHRKSRRIIQKTVPGLSSQDPKRRLKDDDNVPVVGRSRMTTNPSPMNIWLVLEVLFLFGQYLSKVLLPWFFICYIYHSNSLFQNLCTTQQQEPLRSKFVRIKIITKSLGGPSQRVSSIVVIIIRRKYVQHVLE